MFITLKWRNEMYKYNREDGPAKIVKRNNHSFINEWYIDGKRHREKYPAVENYFHEENDFVIHHVDLDTNMLLKKGIYKWYEHDLLHRENDNPSVIIIDNIGKTLEYHYKGKIHRLLGPAKKNFIDNEEFKTYYINGNFYEENKFINIIRIVNKFINKIKRSLKNKYINAIYPTFYYYTYHILTYINN